MFATKNAPQVVNPLERRRVARKGRGRGGLTRRPAPSQMEQLQKLQARMAEVQEELAQATVTATAGGGAVTVVMNGQQAVHSVEIAPEAVDPEDVEMLQDLILVAVNEAIERSQELAAERMGELTGGLGLPGIF